MKKSLKQKKLFFKRTILLFMVFSLVFLGNVRGATAEDGYGLGKLPIDQVAKNIQENKNPSDSESKGIVEVIKELPATIATKVICLFLTLLTTIVSLFCKFFGAILGLSLKILFFIVSIDKFIYAETVTSGWEIVRDLCNVFFVIILLFIAIATILKIETYNYKRALPKLILMAILINFSKMICGVFIDFFQALIVFFGKDVNNFIGILDGFGLSDIFQIQASRGNISEEIFGAIQLLLSAIFSLILIVIVTIVVGVYLIIFVFRIVALWILIILSPLAFLLFAIPGSKTTRYSSMWWDKFIQFVIIGPVLMFFLWLGLKIGSDSALVNNLSRISSGGVSAFPLKSSTPDNVVKFIIMTCFFLGGLAAAQQSGVAGAGIAGTALSKIKSTGQAMLKKPVSWTKGAGKRVDDLQAKAQSAFMKTKMGQRLANETKIGKALGLGKLATHGVALGSLPSAWRSRRASKEREKLGESAAVAEDIMNRALSFGKDKTDRTSVARNARVNEARREVETGSTESRFLISKLKNDYLDKDGNARSGKEAHAAAIVQVLAKNNDFNKLIQDSDIAQMKAFNAGPSNQWQAVDEAGNPVTGVAAARAYNSHNIKTLLRGMFGESEGAHVGSRLHEIGTANKDALLVGLTHGESGGGHAFTSDLDQAQIIEAYIGGREPTENATKASPNDIFTQKADPQGVTRFTSIHDSGDRNFLAYTRDWKDHPNRVSQVARRAVLGNMDIPLAHYDYSTRGEDNKKVFETYQMLISKELGHPANEKDVADYFEEKIMGKHGDERRFMEAAAMYNERQTDPSKMIGIGATSIAARVAAYKTAGEEIMLDKDPHTGSHSTVSEDIRRILLGRVNQAIDNLNPNVSGYNLIKKPNPLAAISEEKYQRTKQLQVEAEEIGISDYELYAKSMGIDESEYLNKDEARQIERMKDLRMEGSFASSVAGFARGDDEVAIDFEKLGIEGLDKNTRGFTMPELKGDQAENFKGAFISALNSEMQDLHSRYQTASDSELEEMINTGNDSEKVSARKAQNIRRAKARLENPEELGVVSFINTGGGREAIIHERAHRDLMRIDESGEKQLAMWRELSPEEQVEREQELLRINPELAQLKSQGETGNRQAMVEYERIISQEHAAHALANTTKWGDKQGFKLTNEQLRDIQESAEDQGVLLKVPIKIEPEEVKDVEIPVRTKTALNAFASKFKNKIAAMVGINLEASEAERETPEYVGAYERLTPRQKRIIDAEMKKKELEEESPMLLREHEDSKGPALFAQNQHKDAKKRRESAEKELANLTDSINAGKKEVAELSVQAEKARGTDPAEYQRLMTESRQKQNSAKEKESQLPALQKEVAESKQEETKTEEWLFSAIRDSKNKKDKLDKNQERQQLLDEISEIYLSLEASSSSVPIADRVRMSPANRQRLSKRAKELEAELANLDMPKKYQRVPVEKRQEVIAEDLREEASTARELPNISSEKFAETLRNIDETLRGLNSSIDNLALASQVAPESEGLKAAIMSGFEEIKIAQQKIKDPASYNRQEALEKILFNIYQVSKKNKEKSSKKKQL